MSLSAFKLSFIRTSGSARRADHQKNGAWEESYFTLMGSSDKTIARHCQKDAQNGVSKEFQKFLKLFKRKFLMLFNEVDLEEKRQ